MKERELEGKVAVITGGVHGLGRGMVELFAEEGACVVFGDIDPDGADLAAELGPSCRFLRTDVSKTADIQALCDLAVNTFGKLDVMCNNAGVPGAIVRLLDDELESFDRVLAINLRGVMDGTRIAGRHMRALGNGGSIINVSSIAGATASYGNVVYRSAKSAVIHYSKTAAIDLSDYAIRVNCLVPGQIATKILKDGFAQGAEPEKAAALDIELRKIMDTYQPLKRKGTPRDVANAAAFLAGDRSAYITGAVLPVDAGITAGDAHNYLDMMLDARARVFEQ